MNVRHIFLSLALLSGISPVRAESFTVGDLMFETREDVRCTLTSGGEAKGEVIIPPSVRFENTIYVVDEIAANAFIGNTAITSVTLPSTIARIGSDAFRRCSFLKDVHASTLKSWMTIDFENEKATPLSNGATLLIDGVPLAHLVVPESVTTINRYSFFDCMSLTEAEIGDQVTAIEPFAFDGCENLSRVSLGNSIKSIGMNAFNICVSLTDINIPQSVQSIGAACFYGCSSLKEVGLPESLTEIPTLAFSGCQSLTDLSFLPRSIRGIGEYAFYNCTGLRQANLPDGVDSIGQYAFSGCSSLENAFIPNNNASLGEFVFIECHALKSIRLPQSLDSIPNGLFCDCTALTDVIIPPTVTRIGDYAFGDCFSLPYIEFPEGLEHIGALSFYGCRLLKSLEFGSSMKSIAAEAFYECRSLREIRCHPIDPISISFFTFDSNADSNAKVYVPEISVDRYLNNMGWAAFENFYGEKSYNPPSHLTIFFGDGGSVSRVVAYATSLTMNLAAADGTLPARIVLDGIDVTDSMQPDGSFSTPEITGPMTLRITGR